MSRAPSDPPTGDASEAEPGATGVGGSFLQLGSGADDVAFSLVDDGSGHADHNDEEAALEALRAAISGTTEQHGSGEGGGEGDGGETAPAGDAPEAASLNNTTLPGTDESEVAASAAANATSASTAPTLVPANQVHVQSLERAVAQMQQLSAANLQLIDSMNAPAMLQSLMSSFKLLADSNRRQAELVKNVVDSIQGRGPPTVDPHLSLSYVPRSDYDALKARYDALVTTNSIATASGGPGTARRARMAPKNAPTLAEVGGNPTSSADEDRQRDVNSSTPLGEDEKRITAAGRKRRSMKLEHVVHKMANRRLGVEYTVSSFEVKGAKELPEPGTVPPSAETSANGVDEFRPDFRADATNAGVRPFIDTVIADCKAAWAEAFTADEPDVDEDQIVRAVTTYWTRLSKRYAEQLSRQRGEIHKDELTRRKQNQYRRQQSLVGRRAAAFDTSPLNLCKLRALYRTLLTIDFAAQTNERPDPKREYTADEWYAYRKKECGARAAEAHEVVDQFWLSANVRSLLAILDAYAHDQSSKIRRKGRPKQPAPTFHLPPELWDRSQLPVLRKKQADGMPATGVGIVLFRFHVDEKVQEQFPEWAAGLYDNPPVPDEDKLLPSLPDVMNANAFYHLKPRIKQLRSEVVVPRMSPEEVQDVLTREPDAATSLEDTEAAVAAVAQQQQQQPQEEGFELGATQNYSDYLSGRGFESVIAMASGSLMNAFGSPTTPSPGATTAPAAPQVGSNPQTPGLSISLDSAPGASSPQNGPSVGSSVRARRQAKRMMSEVPGGAATPVPKKLRREEQAEQPTGAPEVDLTGDASFLESL